jgi:hypothetical protein
MTVMNGWVYLSGHSEFELSVYVRKCGLVEWEREAVYINTKNVVTKYPTGKHSAQQIATQFSSPIALSRST